MSNSSLEQYSRMDSYCSKNPLAGLQTNGLVLVKQNPPRQGLNPRSAKKINDANSGIAIPTTKKYRSAIRICFSWNWNLTCNRNEMAMQAVKHTLDVIPRNMKYPWRVHVSVFPIAWGKTLFQYPGPPYTSSNPAGGVFGRDLPVDT